MRLNNKIQAKEVRLIDSEGNQLGVVSLDDALEKSEAAGLDLVEISPMARPPVCRIMDYNKYLYQEQKKLALAKKKQKQVQVKELKFRVGTEEGDLKVKLRKLAEFIEDGDKVKISVRFKGREMAHKELAKTLFDRIINDFEETTSVESPPKYEGRQVMMVLAPKKKQ